MTIRRALIALCFLLPLSLSACGNNSQKTVPTRATPESHQDISGARNAVAYTLNVLQQVQPTIRQASLLSIYVNILLADGLAVPVTGALDGIHAELALAAPPTQENVDDLYALLEEFGAVLHVDVADLLNRSDDRAHTLDEYATGLGNITERSRRRSEDLKQELTTLKTEEQAQKKIVSGLEKEVKNAVKAKDYSTVQDKQKELTDAQAELTTVESQLKEMSGMQSTFTELFDIAGKRIAALESNREVLIAGLTVVNMPGVEDLGVLEGKAGSTRRSGFSPFGGR